MRCDARPTFNHDALQRPAGAALRGGRFHVQSLTPSTTCGLKELRAASLPPPVATDVTARVALVLDDGWGRVRVRAGF